MSSLSGFRNTWMGEGKSVYHSSDRWGDEVDVWILVALGLIH